VGISCGVCQEILAENLNMHCIAARFVPQLLTNDQKQRHVNVYFELREKANGDPAFISRIITCNKSCIYGYDPETKQQLSQWKSPQSPRAKMAWQVWSSTMSMLIVVCFCFVFFDMKGIVPPNTMVNSDFCSYCDII
jgi:hypothetical protein